ncbi:hypothetical protein ACFYV7_19115 [Nocardia suismassiliense]|uniref:Uncharacterized protein n=1 Tax=Nocardia suismassiliense TaxID=2077092 RepID=A0ABW6QUJ2_9NOCA
MQPHAKTMPRRTTYALVATAALVVVSGGCGSDEQRANNPPPAIDLSRLDVGNYETKPRQLGTVKSLDQARIIEAERLGNFVPAALDIDPRFVHGNPFMATVFVDPEAALGKVMAVDRFAEAAPDFVAGFQSFGRTEAENRGIDLMNAVMVFPDEQKAKDAAAALERVDYEAGQRNTAVPIPKYPAAHAHWQPNQQSIGSWYATGKFVVYTWVYDYLKIYIEKVDLPALIALVEKSLDAVVPSITKFTPTPPDQLMNLQIDLDGMLNRTIARPREDSWLNPPGAYHGRTAIHFANNAAEVLRDIEKAGVDRFAANGIDLYRARDAAAATTLQQDLGGLTKRFKTADSPANLPIAECKEYIGRGNLAIRFYCSVSYDRYAAFSASHQLLDAQQRIAAEYTVLVNAR